MKNIDIHGMTNMELIRGGIAEWYWATDYIHGDLYEAEELFRQGHLVRSNRLHVTYTLLVVNTAPLWYTDSGKAYESFLICCYIMRM